MKSNACLPEFLGSTAFVDSDSSEVREFVALRLFKVTPAFDTELCERFGVRQLIFDGKSDALFHEVDTSSHRHMEYVNDRGWFADPPIGQLLLDFRTTDPRLWQSSIHRVSVSDAKFGDER